MQEDSSNINKGNKGEDLACIYLKKNGFRIVDRNIRTPFGEIDIIAKKKDFFHCFEVKSRNTMTFGSPFEAVTINKQTRIRQAAEYYFTYKNKTEARCLFGVIGVELSNNPPTIECMIDAFT
ncbi:MAG: YraN family protein [Deltaproteobacteria bacterium CG07_land_8_20_14_0_80_38_7]|nr:MAG: YraN family protein [Deltaproteobacteria bacterium CG07_land_8_20_14_0_80_38_7]